MQRVWKTSVTVDSRVSSVKESTNFFIHYQFFFRLLVIFEVEIYTPTRK